MPNKREREARERARAQQKRNQRIRWIAVGIIGVVVVVGIAVALSGVLNPSSAAPVVNAVAASGTCSPVQSFPTQSRDHIQPGQSHPDYSSNPPTSGWHWDNPQEWGIYTTPQIQEQLVHNLEHGGVIVQYNNLTAAEVQRLTDIVKRDSYHMILAPYPGLPSDEKVALTAWDHLQTCTGVDENAIKSFVGALRDKGPEFVP